MTEDEKDYERFGYDRVLEVAKLIAGPHRNHQTGGFTIEQLREVRWQRHLSPSERHQFIAGALALFRAGMITPSVKPLTMEVLNRVSIREIIEDGDATHRFPRR